MKLINLEVQERYLQATTGVFTITPDNLQGGIDDLIAKKEELNDLLHTKGAILLRGFKVVSPEIFRAIAHMFTNDLMSDNGEHNPLPDISGVYTPVSYSDKEKLLWHNENSFNKTWPLMIMFGAAKPANRGGETPIVDSRKILSYLDPAIAKEFIKKGVMYVRTHGFGFGRSWQETYQTNDKSALKEKLSLNNIHFEWCGDDQLITKQIRPAIVKHPFTKELSWFNQVQHWHPYCLKPEVRESLLRIFANDQLPRNCYFGDGSIITDDMLQHILDVYQKLEVSFSWEQGDVMILDNVLFAHARNPYEGERKLFVTMGKQFAFRDSMSSDVILESSS